MELSRKAADASSMSIEVELHLEDYGGDGAAAAADEAGAVAEAEATIADLIGPGSHLRVSSVQLVEADPTNERGFVTFEAVVDGPADEIDVLTAAWNMEDYPETPDDDWEDYDTRTDIEREKEMEWARDGWDDED